MLWGNCSLTSSIPNACATCPKLYKKCGWQNATSIGRDPKDYCSDIHTVDYLRKMYAEGSDPLCATNQWSSYWPIDTSYSWNFKRKKEEELLIGDCWLLIDDCWLLIVDCWMLIDDCWLLIVICYLLFVDCYLLIV